VATIADYGVGDMGVGPTGCVSSDETTKVLVITASATGTSGQDRSFEIVAN